jgi:hypothetical protein
MDKKILFSFFLIACIQNLFASNISKPVSAQPAYQKAIGASGGMFGFIENKGQIIDQNNNLNPSVLYLYNGNGLHVQLKQTGFSYEVWKVSTSNKQLAISKFPNLNNKLPEADSIFIHRIDISFVGANQNAKIISIEPASDYINYYTTGTSEAGVTNVHHYKKVLYQNIYNNIDVEFELNDKKNCGNFKYNFIVHPNGNVNDIQLKFDGTNSTSLTNDGHIIIETAYGNIDESIPSTYQLDANNNQQIIAATFKSILHLPTSNIYGLSVEQYDATKTLIIDPAPWATYFGGSGGEWGYSIDKDASGNIFITGTTNSTSGMATSGAYQISYGGGSNDAFIAKFNSSGSCLWATYFGGSTNDAGSGIRCDVAGNVFITGNTQSTASIASSGAFQTTYGGGAYDAFVAKFNSSGSRIWATYFGGVGSDNGQGITIDISGNVSITGWTYSNSGIATSGANQTSFGGGCCFGGDAFIAKFNSGGSLQWATYYGDNGVDIGYGIASDASGNLVITGLTVSPYNMVTSGAFQSAYGGGTYDSFIAKFNSSGVIQWATFYGGNFYDVGFGITTDINSNILITGSTSSTTGIVSSGAFQTAYGGSTGLYGDAFIAKFNSSGSRIWATYYGGTLPDQGLGITSDTIGNVFVIGLTNSSTGIATSGAFQTALSSSYNQNTFVVKFDSSGSRLWGTYYGGANDYGQSITTELNGKIIFTGQATSTTGIATSGAYQTTLLGGNDAFITELTSSNSLPVQLMGFDAKLANNNSVLCTWQTASELNNDYFEIERSTVGSPQTTDWKVVGKVKGNGTTNSVHSYQFTDNVMLSGIEASNIYYRLKQIDFDGKSSLSDIRVVNLPAVAGLNEVNNEINIYPNPTNDRLNISLSQQSSSTTIQLFDITGRIVKNVNTQNNINQIDVSDLCNGLYFINISNQEINVSRKVIIDK